MNTIPSVEQDIPTPMNQLDKRSHEKRDMRGLNCMTKSSDSFGWLTTADERRVHQTSN